MTSKFDIPIWNLNTLLSAIANCDSSIQQVVTPFQTFVLKANRQQNCIFCQSIYSYHYSAISDQLSGSKEHSAKGILSVGILLFSFGLKLFSPYKNSILFFISSADKTFVQRANLFIHSPILNLFIETKITPQWFFSFFY